ncbi:MAGUK p55 subfamily member 4 [Platysternon megacephalum]|uniref:MAGUK p55 subfamily member 4 n=1 Tax=Platysternon megacephalum TaxID=55544 RepID=A0A4D9F7G3_9SAUR|nr:MAGUK p55 subfamily member 4 [Platysternon megacephalum]
MTTASQNSTCTSWENGCLLALVIQKINCSISNTEKRGESPRVKEKMEMLAVHGQETGLSHVLTLVLQELSLFCKRDVNGVGVLYDLLRSPWLQALLKVYECLHQSIRRKPVPVTPQARALSREVVELLRGVPQSTEIRELRRLLRNPNLKALLSAHDTVAQKDFEPILPPLPDNIPENEEAMRIVCLVKNKQPLGATIKRHEITGDIVVARVIHGGLADRSGLLYAGDKLVEVNGVPVEGLEPEQVIHILSLSQGTIMFKLIPVSDRPVSNQTTLYVRAMADYWPLQDPAIPCADAGLPFKKGEILQIVDQNDVLWWQARQVSDLSACAGLIPSNHLLKRKQREFWWSQPFQPHVCLKSAICECKILQLPVRVGREKSVFLELVITCTHCLAFNISYFLPFPAGFRRSMRLCRRKSQNSQQPCYARCPSSCYSAAAAPYEEVVRYQRHPTDRNRLIVLVGPSGVGVNELRRRLIGMNPHHFQSAVPHTTRAQKSYEENGREYHYVSKETFENMVYSHRWSLDWEQTVASH